MSIAVGTRVNITDEVAKTTGAASFEGTIVHVTDHPDFKEWPYIIKCDDNLLNLPFWEGHVTGYEGEGALFSEDEFEVIQ